MHTYELVLEYVRKALAKYPAGTADQIYREVAGHLPRPYRPTVDAALVAAREELRIAA